MSENTPSAPTCNDLYEALWAKGSAYKSVQREADDSWRHGSYVTQVFHREGDDTFWRASYRLSTDQETNELREGDAEIVRVYPVTVSTVEYRAEATHD